MGRRNTSLRRASFLFVGSFVGVLVAFSNFVAIPWRCHVDPSSFPSNTDTVVAPKKYNVSLLPLITNSDLSSSTSCHGEFVWIPNKVNNRLRNNNQGQQSHFKIPRIIHQTSKSRCVTRRVARAIEKWQFTGWDYYFHDDEAVRRLLHTEFPEFPHLSLVSKYCLIHGTVKADLWRYLVLWVYGGIYADIDAVPAMFGSDTLSTEDDAFFVVEQYHLLSQYFMALSPRHPLMYYAIQKCLVSYPSRV
jgi:hypothetical protein